MIAETRLLHTGHKRCHILLWPVISTACSNDNGSQQEGKVSIHGRR